MATFLAINYQHNNFFGFFDLFVELKLQAVEKLKVVR